MLYKIIKYWKICQVDIMRYLGEHNLYVYKRASYSRSYTSYQHLGTERAQDEVEE